LKTTHFLVCFVTRLDRARRAPTRAGSITRANLPRTWTLTAHATPDSTETRWIFLHFCSIFSQLRGFQTHLPPSLSLSPSPSHSAGSWFALCPSHGPCSCSRSASTWTSVQPASTTVTTTQCATTLLAPSLASARMVGRATGYTALMYAQQGTTLALRMRLAS